MEPASPRGKLQLAKAFSEGDISLSDYSQHIFATCLLCGACSSACPSGVELRRIFLNMRDEIVQERGLQPIMKRLVQSLEANHNISGEENIERADWKELLTQVPGHEYQKDEAEVIYFVGCVASFFPMVQNIPKNLVQILDLSGVNFTILAGEEWCCGFPLIGAGSPKKMNELKKHNLQQVKTIGAKKLVFSCPSCYQTWKEYYDTDLELFHSTQFIEKIISADALPLKETKLKVTYHDPCDLGRQGGEFDAPRQILASLPGIELIEMKKNRIETVCCGGGGNMEMADPELSRKIAQKKIEEIVATGVRTVVTSCQQCVRTINAEATRQKIELDVMDIAELVMRAFSSKK
jgi:heterodisulfide reductase subunit D